MIRVLVDADLLLEAVLNRICFVADAEEAFEMLQSQQIQGYVSELGLEKIYSVLSKLEDSQVAEEIVATIEEVVETYPINSTLIQQARSLNIRDFESAVEVVCATATNVGAILTSDPQAFAGGDLPVMQVGDLWQRQHLERMLQRDASPVLLVSDLLELQRLEELLEKGRECLRQIAEESPTEPLDDDSQHLDFSRERQNFDAQFRMLLDRENSDAQSVLACVRLRLRQFHLDGDDVTSILHEAYLRGVQTIERGRSITKFSTWIRTTAGYIIRENSRKPRLYELPLSVFLESVIEAPTALEEEFDANQVQTLRMALQQLDPSERKILHLRYFQNLSWHQVSKQLAREEGEVRSSEALRKRGYRILQRLRHLYQKFLS